MVAVGLLFLVGGFLLVAPFLAGNQQQVSVLKARGTLVEAYREFTNTGSLARFSGDVWLSSNGVTVGSTQYQCLLEKRCWGTLALTTNFTIIWLRPNGVSEIIPTP